MIKKQAGKARLLAVRVGAASLLTWALCGCSGGSSLAVGDGGYGEAAAAVLSSEEAEVFERVASGVEERALPRPTAADASLSAAAALLAGHVAGGGTVTPLSVRRAMELAGAFDPFVFSASAPAGGFAKSTELSDLLDRSASWTANCYGVASSDGHTVVLSTFRTADLDPLPGSVSVGETVAITGQVHEVGATLRLLVQRNGSEGSALEPVQVGEDGKFTAQLTVPDQDFVIFELVGVGDSWGRSYAHARLAVKGEAPDSFEGLAISAPPTTGIQGWVWDQVNLGRDRFGLSFLVKNPGLQALVDHDIREISQGIDPLRGFDGLDERLAKWGMTPVDAKMIRVEVTDPAEVFATLWYDPALRGRILDTTVSHVGLSVSDHPAGASGRYTLLAYLTAPIVEHDPAMDLEATLEALNSARKAAGASAVRLDPELTALLQAHAYPLLVDREAAIKAPQLVVDAARASRVPFTYAYVDIAVAKSPEMLVFVSEITQAKWKKVGIATARGRFGDDAEPVVLALVIGVR